MNYTLLRNATAVLALGGQRFLIDPMLDPKDARPPVASTPNQHPNPLVDLPAGWQNLIDGVDALVVTHLHKDHSTTRPPQRWITACHSYAQPEDSDRLEASGFRDGRPVETKAGFGDATLVRTAGHHGTGEIGKAMAPVSGFVFDAPNESRVYVAGDTVWCAEVSDVIRSHQLEVIVLNGSGARYLEGDPIVMTADDIAQVYRAAPDALLIVVHLEAINHCLETRHYYRETLPALGIPLDRFRIPEDGEGVIW